MTPRRFYTAVVLLFGGAYAWLAFVASTSASDVIFCLFRRLSGMPCPACGATRSVVALCYGEWLYALRLNPLGFFYTIALVSVPLWLLHDTIRRRPSMYTMYRRLDRLMSHKSVLWGIAAFILLNWLWVLFNHVFGHVA
ncbi:DUF2752 domain-containing protein [Porphyromonas sp.]|uniref:DUF2752 domain-containing protein n=1 Tax=Porphyromonas sp. TaxID=1924944 RepID=UPI0026DD672B|nr:DUF2752 domain-containing protein [Porphyromonas sp.]MDO4771323.1 DUF2752 domain-containing protein [Porphyromonas sp.]